MACKVCNKCKVEKQLGEFEKRRVGADGHRGTCKECRETPALKEKRRQYHLRSKDKHAAYKKDYYQKNRDRILNQKKEYLERNREQILKKAHERYWKDHELSLKRSRARQPKQSANHKARLKRDPAYKLRCLLSIRTSRFLRTRNASKKNPLLQYIGLTPDRLRAYLEWMFQDSMTWENYGTIWHIDHIIPLSWADPSNEEDLARVLHYSNLQPLWAQENQSKGNRLNYGS